MKTGVALAVCSLVLGGEPAWGQSTWRVSVASGGNQVLGTSFDPPAIAGARFVAFRHTSTSLVAGDTNAVDDVFLHDRSTGTISTNLVTTRVSVASGNVQANGLSYQRPAISTGASFVAFTSAATNLVAGDTNARDDVFVRNRAAGTTTRLSVGPNGAQGNDFSRDPAISADGRFVAFRSAATNLVGGDTNAQSDVFVHDRTTGTTTRVSVASGGGQANEQSTGPAISADGRFVAFTSRSSNLVAGDTNGVPDIFVRDRTAGTTTRVSMASGNVQATGTSFRPAISGDGRFVAFQSAATNLVAGDSNNLDDVFVHDRTTATTTRVSVASGNVQANHFSSSPSISGDGRFVAFNSFAGNLSSDINGRTDVFVHDRATGDTTAVSLARENTFTGNEASQDPSISVDGRYVAFRSGASNLITGDNNNGFDVFVRDRGAFAGFRGAWERVTLRCAANRSPQRCTVGGRVEITNPGNRTAAASQVRFLLSTDRRLDARDQLIGRRSLAPLRAGKTRTVRLTRVLERDVSGRFVIASLDATGRVAEPNEQDNVVVSEPLSRRRILLRINGTPRFGVRSSVRVRITDASGRPIRNAAVSISSAGLQPITKRSGGTGTVSFALPPLGRGTAEIRASHRGYATTTVYRKIR